MNIEDEILGNPILRNVQAKFQNQQVKGLAKYGETVNPKSYNAVAWLLHLQEELIDATVYVETATYKIKEIVEENKRLREALQFYANPNHWLWDEPNPNKCVKVDEGKIARKALEGETK